jgi:hypothetical protein
MPATLPQLLRRHYLHAPPPLGSPLAKPQPPAAAPRAPAPARIIIHAQPAFASTRPQRSWLPMHAAYHRGPATSAASSLRDSVPATLPQLLGSSCLHAPPPLGAHLAKPPPPAPAPRVSTQARNTQHHPCIAGVRKHPLTAQLAADACTQHTAEDERRQLRHPQETQCQRRSPS